MAQSEVRSRVPSLEEREKGLRSYLNHSSWNGIGINLLNITMISLLAINFGATNLQIGYISSVFHIAGIILVFTPRLLTGRNIRDIFFWSWLIRGFVSFLYGVLFFLTGQAAVVTVMGIFTVFAAMRIIGAPMTQPLQKNLSRPSEVGDVVTRQQFRMSVSQVFSQLASFAILSVRALSGTAGLILITFLGAGANTVASYYIKKIPSREVVDYRPGRSVYQVFRRSMREGERRKSLIIRWVALSSTILFGFVIAYLRRSVGMPSNFVFLYTVAGGLAATAASYVLKPFADRIGSKPLLIASTLALALTAVGWALLSPSLPWVVYYGFGFVTFFLIRVRLMLITRLLIHSIPERDKISYSSMMNFGSALVALAVGLGGGGLADLGALLFTQGTAGAAGASAAAVGGPFHPYSLTFLLAGLLAAAAGIVAFGLHDRGSLTLRETAEILLSIRNLRAFLNVYKLDTEVDPAKREANLLSLERSNAPLATNDLRARLRVPTPAAKERILRSLAAYPRRQLLSDIVAEAEDSGSYTRLAAIRTLGAYPARRARKALAAMIEEPDSNVAAAALRSLARIVPRGHAPTTPTTDDIVFAAWRILNDPGANPRAMMDSLRCLASLGPHDSLWPRLFSVVTPERGKRFEQLGLIVVTRNLHLHPSLAAIFHQENITPGAGVRELLAECAQFQRFYERRDETGRLIDEEEYEYVWFWVRAEAESFRGAPESSLGAKLLRAVSGDRVTYSRWNTMMILYLLFHALALERDVTRS